MFIKVLILTLALISIAFMAIGIKMFLKKDGEFTKTCGTVNPETGERTDCVCSSKKECKNNDVAK